MAFPRRSSASPADPQVRRGRPPLAGPSAPPAPGQPPRGLRGPRRGGEAGAVAGAGRGWGGSYRPWGGSGRVPALRTVAAAGLWPQRPLQPRWARGNARWRVRCCGGKPVTCVGERERGHGPCFGWNNSHLVFPGSCRRRCSSRCFQVRRQVPSTQPGWIPQS